MNQQPSKGFLNAVGLALIATLLCALIQPTQKYTPWVGGSLLVLLVLRYRRTGGQ